MLCRHLADLLLVQTDQRHLVDPRSPTRLARHGVDEGDDRLTQLGHLLNDVSPLGGEDGPVAAALGEPLLDADKPPSPLVGLDPPPLGDKNAVHATEQLQDAASVAVTKELDD